MAELRCPLCGRAYRTAGPLARHLGLCHKDEIEIVTHASRCHRKHRLSFLEELALVERRLPRLVVKAGRG